MYGAHLDDALGGRRAGLGGATVGPHEAVGPPAHTAIHYGEVERARAELPARARRRRAAEVELVAPERGPGHVGAEVHRLPDGPAGGLARGHVAQLEAVGAHRVHHQAPRRRVLRSGGRQRQAASGGKRR